MTNNGGSGAQGSWIISWILAGVCGWWAVSLWEAGQRGSDASSLGAAALGLITVMLFFRGLNLWDQRSQIRQLKRAQDAPTTAHGRARWGSEREAKQAGMFRNDGPFIGRLGRHDLHYPGEAHLMTIAPAGAGKGTSIVVPSLLNYRGSMIVTDPKGELCAMTARHRAERLGHRVIVLNPWREKLREELGRDLGDDGFNPLSVLRVGPSLKDEAELIASLLLPGQPGMSESESYFLDFGQTVLTGVLLYMVSRSDAHPLTLPELRRLLMCPPKELQTILTGMAASSAFGGLLAEYGGRLGTTLINSAKEFQGGLSTAQKAMRIYDRYGPLGAHVAGASFDFGSLKDVPTTVYVIIPHFSPHRSDRSDSRGGAGGAARWHPIPRRDSAFPPAARAQMPVSSRLSLSRRAESPAVDRDADQSHLTLTDPAGADTLTRSQPLAAAGAASPRTSGNACKFSQIRRSNA